MIFLFACSGDEPAAVIPSNADIARAEAALAGHPCVGSLDDWERHYRFRTKRATFGHWPVTTDFAAIEFRLRRAGTVSSQAGLVVHAVDPPHPFPPVAPRERTLSGVFALQGDRLSIKGC